MLGVNKEVERANAPGRTKEADAHMKGYVQQLQSVLQTTVPPCTATQCPTETCFAAP